MRTKARLMVKAGLTRAKALQTATAGTAQCLSLADDFEMLEKEKRADLTLLDADPVKDIRNTRKISKVWIRDRQVS